MWGDTGGETYIVSTDRAPMEFEEAGGPTSAEPNQEEKASRTTYSYGYTGDLSSQYDVSMIALDGSFESDSELEEAQVEIDELVDERSSSIVDPNGVGDERSSNQRSCEARGPKVFE